MACYKPYDYNQTNMIPVSLEKQLIPGTLEYAMHYIIEEHLDLSLFNERYRNDITGRKAIDPKVLLKIVLFGYSRGLISSRRLEKACMENVVFMAMSCGEIPDHSTIAEFISLMGIEVVPIFIQVLLICEEEGLLGSTHFSIDGLKLPSNASKEWSGKFEDLKVKKDKLEKKVKEGNNNFKTVRGYKGINYQAPKTACRNCKLRVKCLRNSKTESRQVYVFYEKRSGLTDGMREKIDTPQGRKTY